MCKASIIIIGGGFSGTLTALNIMRIDRDDTFRIILIERSPTVGRGLAYMFSDDNLLLNVPAGNMSALPDEPDHFVHYCQTIDVALNAKSFVSRRMYGDYLEHTLAKEMLRKPGALTLVAGEAAKITKLVSSGDLRVTLACGSEFVAPSIVLALGHFPSVFPHSLYKELNSKLVNAWDFDKIDRIDTHKPVVILGMGHTAIDTAFRLTSCNSHRKVFLLSRRGLLPLGHRQNPTIPFVADYPSYLLNAEPTVRTYLHALRKQIVSRQLEGGDWRDVINELRPHTSKLWLSLSETERRRFLKKVLPYWDVHRHRLAPVARSRLDRLIDSKQLLHMAILDLVITPISEGVKIAFKSRHDGVLWDFEASTVINCTGPNQDLSKISNPLLHQLMTDGYVKQDPLKLGLLVDDGYRVIDTQGHPVVGLFYIGPMLKAKLWESIAIPELRVHALKLAQCLSSRCVGLLEG